MVIERKGNEIKNLLKFTCVHHDVEWPLFKCMILSRKLAHAIYTEFFCIKKLKISLIFSIFLLKTYICGYTLEPTCRGGSNEYPQSMFRIKIQIGIPL